MRPTSTVHLHMSEVVPRTGDSLLCGPSVPKPSCLLRLLHATSASIIACNRVHGPPLSPLGPLESLTVTLEVCRRLRGAAHGALVAMCTGVELLGARLVHPLPAACEPHEPMPRSGQRLQADPAYISLARGGHPPPRSTSFSPFLISINTVHKRGEFRHIQYSTAQLWNHNGHRSGSAAGLLRITYFIQ